MSHCSTTVPAEIFLGYLIERKGGIDAFAVVKSVHLNFLKSQFFS